MWGINYADSRDANAMSNVLVEALLIDLYPCLKMLTESLSIFF